MNVFTYFKLGYVYFKYLFQVILLTKTESNSLQLA